MRVKDININGKVAKGYEISLPNATLVAVLADKGYIMCGYLNPETSDKFNDCAAIIKGVNSIEEILDKEVSWISKAAIKAGIKPGMTGLEALILMF